MFNQFSWATRAQVRGPEGSTSCLGDLCPCPRACRFHQLSQVTRNHARGRGCRTAVPGDSRLGLRALGIDQLSRATQAHALRPTVSTNSLGRLGFGSVVPRSTSCPGQLGPVPDVPRD